NTCNHLQGRLQPGATPGEGDRRNDRHALIWFAPRRYLAPDQGSRAPDEESGPLPAVRAGGRAARPARGLASRRDGVPGITAAGRRRRVGCVAQAEDQPDEGSRPWLSEPPTPALPHKGGGRSGSTRKSSSRARASTTSKTSI